MTITDLDKDIEKMESLYIDGGNIKQCSHFGKLFFSFLKCYPAILFLCHIYSGEMKAYVHIKNLYTNVHNSDIDNTQKVEITPKETNY